MSRPFLAAAMVVAGTAMAWADDPGHLPPNTPPVAGYYDPATHTFTALADSPAKLQAPPPGSAAAATPTVVRGTMIIKATVTLDPSIPASASLTMTGAAYIQDRAVTPPNANSYANTSFATGTVTRSGATATGTVTFPFTAVVTTSTYQMQINVYFSSSVSGTPTVHFQTMMPVPANGSTTTVSFPGAI